MLLRYQEEKSLDPLGDDDLFDTVRFFDEHFTYSSVPTDRIKEVYLEAMAHHGPYILKVDDFLRAWERIRPTEGAGADLRHMSERGAGCTRCQGTGTAKKFVPYSLSDLTQGEEIEFPCPFGCRAMLVKV